MSTTATPRRVLDQRCGSAVLGRRRTHSVQRSGRRHDLALNSVNLDGEDKREHLLGDWVTGYRVSPNGRWVAFTEHYNAYVAPFFPAGKQIPVGGKTSAYPVRQVSARGGEMLHWSGDSAVLGWSYGHKLYRRNLSDAFAFLEGAPEELPAPETEGRDLSFEVEADRPDGRIALTGGRVVTMRDAYAQQEVIENGTCWSTATGSRRSARPMRCRCPQVTAASMSRVTRHSRPGRRPRPRRDEQQQLQPRRTGCSTPTWRSA